MVTGWVWLALGALAVGCGGARANDGVDSGAEDEEKSEPQRSNDERAMVDAAAGDSGDAATRSEDITDGGRQPSESPDAGFAKPEVPDDELDAAVDDGDAGKRVPDAEPPPADVVVPCREQYADYDCETSRSVFDDSELERLLRVKCGGCHQPEATSAFPPFDGEPPLPHDAVLGLTHLEDERDSRLVQIVREGHGCWGECGANADELLWELWDWQHKISVRRARLEAFAEARDAWLALGIASYQWHVQNGCFNCFYEHADNVLAAVNEGVVEALRIGEVYTNQTPADPAPLSLAKSWHTVEGLFGSIEWAILQDADQLNVAYHEQLRYPTSVHVDYRFDWHDEEDYFSAGDLIPLDAGYCIAAGPFSIPESQYSATRCSSTAECGTCAPMQAEAVQCSAEPVVCTEDSHCPDDYVCEPQTERCSYSSTHCVPACTMGSCETTHECQPDGHCSPRSCSDDSSLCFSAAHCDPQAADSDLFGCLPPTCEETEIECALFESCDPETADARANGCAPKSCQSDQDCGCGSCVNQRCSPVPGVCH